jgi:tRNA (cmo5U34)-methyltransferase
MTSSWHDGAKAAEYLERVDRLAARRAGEAELVDVVPPGARRVVDLGCGDGRLAALVLACATHVESVIAVDDSPPMLALAASRFAADPRVTVLAHDLRMPLPPFAGVDLVVSGFAIHHLAHERKQSLFGEIASALSPGGVFANLEVVQCATPEIHAAFNERIGRPGGDPEDVLATVDEQIGWMRAAGLEQVDCYWRWRGFALLVGRAPAAG